MYYVFLFNKDKSYGYEEIIHKVDFYNCKLLVIYCENEKDLFNKIFSDIFYFKKLFLVYEHYSLLLDKQLRKNDNDNDKIRKVKELFTEKYFIKQLESCKRVKISLFENLSQIDIFYEVLKKITKIDIDYEIIMPNNYFKKIFLKGSLENLSSIKRFVKNNSFDKNLLKLIFSFL